MDNTVEVQELGKVMITPKGEYSSSKSYEILDAVSYNGSSYVSKINDNTSVPTSNDWQLLAQKGDVYDVTEEDLQAIAKQITDNVNSAFNQNVKAKTKEFNTNAINKLNDYDTNVKSTTETFDANAKKKLDEYNANDTKKLKAYNDNADNKLSAYNTNDTNKLKAYNTNADSKIEEYNTNANSKIAEYDKHSEELRNMAISTDNELERVKNEILDTGSASDSFIHVEDSCMAKLKELEIDGVFEQETTIGKNLLNVQKNLQQIKKESYSITPVYSNGMLKYIKLNGTFNAWTGYSILGAKFTLSPGTYVQSFHKEGTFSNGSVYIDSSLSITSIESDNFAKVLSDDLNVSKYKICVNAGTVCNNLKLYPMIAKEDKASNYEPFTNGASPNPDYPQEIKTITDSLKVTSCGENLIKVTNSSTTINGVTFTVNKDNTVTANGTATANSIFMFASGLRIRVKNETYSLKGCPVGGDSSTTYKMDIQDSKNEQPLADFGNMSSYSIKYYDNPTIVAGRIVVYSGYTANNLIFKPYFVKGTTFKSEYESYIESQIQAKLPKDEFIGKLDNTYKDTLRAEYFPEKRQYHWMLDKKVGKHVFTGNENWSTYTQSNGIPIFRCTLPASGYVVKSNYFVSQTTWPTLLEENRIFNHVGNYQNIEIACSKFDTLTNFKNILTTNAVQMYYGLKTPYTLDLGPIDIPLSYKGITNIFTDSDLLPKITAKYYRTFEKTILNMQINEKSLKQEITDLNNNISDITKRLEVLESANVSTVEEGEASNDLQN